MVSADLIGPASSSRSDWKGERPKGKRLRKARREEPY
jgi:hypothetical protein